MQLYNRPIHGTMRLSVIVCLDILCQSIYCAIALFKVFESQLLTKFQRLSSGSPQTGPA